MAPAPACRGLALAQARHQALMDGPDQPQRVDLALLGRIPTEERRAPVLRRHDARVQRKRRRGEQGEGGRQHFSRLSR